MDSAKSELQFFDFSNLGVEEAKRLKDILKSTCRDPSVELPWDVNDDDVAVPEGASESSSAVYTPSALQPLNQSVSTVPIPPPEAAGVFPAPGYEVTASLSHTDSLPINSSLPVSSPPFVPQQQTGGSLPSVTNVAGPYATPQGFPPPPPFDIRTLAFPYANLGFPLVRPMGQHGSQDVSVYPTNASFPPGHFAAATSSDGMCQSEKSGASAADAKLDESSDMKQKRLSGDKRKVRRGRGSRGGGPTGSASGTGGTGGSGHVAPYYSSEIGAPVDSYGQTPVLPPDEPIAVNIQPGTTMDVAQSQQLPATTVAQSLNAPLIPYTIHQQPFTVPSATLPIAAPSASTPYPPGVAAIHYPQIPNQTPSMYFLPMYAPPMFPGYMAPPSATSPVVTSGPSTCSNNSDVMCQSSSSCPHGIAETSVTTVNCQEAASYNQSEGGIIVPASPAEANSETMKSEEAPPMMKAEEEAALQDEDDGCSGQQLEKQVDGDGAEDEEEEPSGKDATESLVAEVDGGQYNAVANCSLSEMKQPVATVGISSEVKVNDSNVNLPDGSHHDAKENVTTTVAPSVRGHKSWADLFKENSSSSSDVRMLNAKVAGLAPSPPLSCNMMGEQEEASNNNNAGSSSNNNSSLDMMGPTTVSPREDSLAKKLGKHLMDFQPNHATRYFQPRGLINRSNWCYINATLQALVACPPLFNLLRELMSQIGTKRGKSSTPIVDSLVEFVKNFSQMQPIHKMKKKEELVVGQPFEPESIYHMLNIIKSDCAKGRQEDAEEFLSFVLNGLHDEMYNVIQAVQDEEQKCNGDLTANGHDDDSGDEGAWRMMGKRNKSMLTRSAKLNPSPISRIFGGQMRSVLKTGRDSNNLQSANLQPFFTLQLDIQSERVESVKEALAQLTATETIHGYVNNKTGQVIEAERQITIEELPPVLILHFKWFVYDKDGGCKKLMKKMDYSIDLELDKEFLSADVRSKFSQKHRSYKLFAVVYHEGKEAVKGHYVADVYHSGSGGWLRCDDKTITPIQDNQVLKYSSPRVPYLLFYRRLDTAQRNYATNAADSSSTLV